MLLLKYIVVCRSVIRRLIHAVESWASCIDPCWLPVIDADITIIKRREKGVDLFGLEHKILIVSPFWYPEKFRPLSPRGSILS